MDRFLQTLAAAMAALTAILILKKHNGAFALALSAAGAILLCGFVLETVRPVVSLLRRLEALSGVAPAVLAPVFKAAVIGVLTNIAAGVCADSGETGLGRMVELCGTVMALHLSVPLITAVLDLLDSLLGG